MPAFLASISITLVEPFSGVRIGILVSVCTRVGNMSVPDKESRVCNAYINIGHNWHIPVPQNSFPYAPRFSTKASMDMGLKSVFHIAALYLLGAQALPFEGSDAVRRQTPPAPALTRYRAVSW